MKSVLLVFSLLLIAQLASALPEDKAYSVVKQSLLANQTCSKSDQAFWTRHIVETPLEVDKGGNELGTKKYRMRMSQFGCGIGERGSLVLGPGRGESSIEYYETAMDFIAKGFSPIFVLDHRGQGLSPRLLPDLSKSHIENFKNYIVDFHYATLKVQKYLTETYAWNSEKKPLYYTSNSMGGGIGIGYLQYLGARDMKSPYKRMALLSPMIKVNYISFVNKKPTFLYKKIYSEVGALTQARLRCFFGICDNYAAKKTFGPYTAGKRTFKPDFELTMTHSKNRFELRDFLWDEFDWSSIIKNEYSGENWKGPQIGGSTNAWVLHSTKFLREMRDAKTISTMDTTPVLLISGTRDLRSYEEYMDKEPDLKNQEAFCTSINKVKSSNQCEFVALEGAFHEIYKESDFYRQQGMKLVDEYLR